MWCVMACGVRTAKSDPHRGGFEIRLSNRLDAHLYTGVQDIYKTLKE
jgi:hypothetical protein